MIKFENLSQKFEGVKKITFPEFKDKRGTFKKFYSEEHFKMIMPYIDEVFFSKSKKNVFRGIHAQKRPKEIEKIIICAEGEIIDFFVDLREGSKYFGEFQTYSLSEYKNEGIFIPKGYGHGYQVVSDQAMILYAQSGKYDPTYEIGVNPLSLDIDSRDFILSDKDKLLPNLEDLKMET